MKSRLLALLRRGTALEWGFGLGLALPIAILTMVLRSIRVVERGAMNHVVRWIDVYKSDVLFLLAFSALGLALLAAFRGRKRAYFVFAGLQAVAAIIALTEVVSFRFFMSTGSTLDFQLIYFTLSQLMMTFDVVASEVPSYIWWMMGGSATAAVFVPWATARAWAKWAHPLLGVDEAPPPIGRKVAIGGCVAALVVFLLALAPPMKEQNAAFARNATLTVASSALWSLTETMGPEATALTRTADAVMVPRSLQAKKRNVVVILLESTRARSTSVYNEELTNTPHLEELAKKSIVAEHAHAVVPHTSKALVTTLCGIEPRLHVPITEATPDGIPGKCLAKMLGENGYRTAFMQAATQRFENRRVLVDNMGYDTFVPLERMDTKGWEKVNYFGNEDDIMLKPSEDWLDDVGDDPFLLTFLTLTPHHNYLAPRRYGRHHYVENDEYNRYLNTIHYVDAFVNNVIEMFKRKGLYEDTIFVVLGDHGEGFREHGRTQHDNVIWEEGLHIPLIIHDPTRFQDGGKRIPWTTNQLDVIPTLADLLGYELKNAEFPGESMLKLDHDRTLYAHCWYERRCMAAIWGEHKLIYHFDQRPDQYFNLKEDPLEKKSKIDELKDLEKRRSDMIAWRSKVNAIYRSHTEDRLQKYVTDQPPVMEYPLDNVKFGDFVRLVGVDYPREELKPGSNVSVTFVYEVLEKPPVEWKLFLHGESKGTKLKNLDHPPVDGLHPLEDWEPGEFVSDNVRFRIPKGARGEYTLWLGFYHPKDGRAEITGIETDNKKRAKVVTLKLKPTAAKKKPSPKKKLAPKLPRPAKQLKMPKVKPTPK